MELVKNTKVTFVELPGTDLHRYLLKRKKGAEPEQIIGVTSLMKRMGLSKGYGKVSPDVLARASARGTAIHELLQGYEIGTPVSATICYQWTCQDGSVQETEEDVTKMLQAYRSLSKDNIKCVAVEYMVSDNDCVASLIDLVSEVDENTVDLMDYKSSSSLDKKGLSWQLSFYKYLFERQNKKIKVRNLLGIHCHDKNVKMVSVPYQGDDAVEGMIKAYKEGEPLVTETAELLPDLVSLVPEHPMMEEALLTKLRLQEQMEAIEEYLKEATEELKTKMTEGNYTQVKASCGKYILVAEHDSVIFNTTKFKADHPDLYEKYSVTTTSPAALRFLKG